MNIQEVCEATGWSEKKIILYIKEGLIIPVVEEGVEGIKYRFSDDDVVRIRDVKYLRDAGYGIEAIREMLDNPSWIAGQPEESVRKIERDKKLNPPKANKFLRIFYMILFLCGVGVASWLYYARFGTVSLTDIYIAFAAILALICIFMSVRYATVALRGRKKEHHGTGTVLAVVQEHGFNISYSRAGMNYAGTREPGLGGPWQFFFLFWNEIRRDCWFPVIDYVDGNGEHKLGTFPYGGWKRSWKEGDVLEIAWNDKDPDNLYPCSGRWIIRKSATYIGMTVLLMICGFGFYSLRNLPSSLYLPEEIDRAVMVYDGGTYDLDEEEYSLLYGNISRNVIKKSRKSSSEMPDDYFLVLDIYQQNHLLMELKFDHEGYIYEGDRIHKVPANENQLASSRVFADSLQDCAEWIINEKEK